MKKLFIFSCAFVAILACKEEQKDYVTLTGKITDKNSDSLVVRSRGYTKTMQVNEDGTFKDTLKIETGQYFLYDGSESIPVFLKNGFDLTITLDAKAFDESAKYSGKGSEHSNFLAKRRILQKKILDIDKLSSLNMAGLETEMDNIKNELISRNR